MRRQAAEQLRPEHPERLRATFGRETDGMCTVTAATKRRPPFRQHEWRAALRRRRHDYHDLPPVTSPRERMPDRILGFRLPWATCLGPRFTVSTILFRANAGRPAAAFRGQMFPTSGNRPHAGRTVNNLMATPSRSRSKTSDRRRVSSERHEISYAASRLEKGKRGGRGASAARKTTRAKSGKATTAVKRAKSQLGRKTARPKVMKRARAISRRK